MNAIMKRKPNAYDRDQHELICKAIEVSSDPKEPGDTAYEAVCELLLNIYLANKAKSLEQAIAILNAEPGTMPIIPLYGTEK